MRQLVALLFSGLVASLNPAPLAGVPSPFAQVPASQQKYEEHFRSAQQIEMLSYVLVGAGLMLVVVAIPVGLYLNRKKKNRKGTEQHGADAKKSSPRVEPDT
jgi:hypothetical protein